MRLTAKGPPPHAHRFAVYPSLEPVVFPWHMGKTAVYVASCLRTGRVHALSLRLLPIFAASSCCRQNSAVRSLQYLGTLLTDLESGSCTMQWVLQNDPL